MVKKLLSILGFSLLSLLFVQCSFKGKVEQEIVENVQDKLLEEAQKRQIEATIEQKVQEHRDALEGEINSEFKNKFAITVNAINKQCPVMIDDVTRFDSCSATSDATSITYFYTIMYYAEMFNEKASEENIKAVLVEAVKTSPTMKMFRKAGVIFNYEYRSLEGNEILTVSVTPKDYE